MKTGEALLAESKARIKEVMPADVLGMLGRGEKITCLMLNNGVFGETGGHLTATTVLGQRTKNTLEGRNAADHGYPILLSNLLAQLEGAAFVARGAVNTAGNVRITVTRARGMPNSSSVSRRAAATGSASPGSSAPPGKEIWPGWWRKSSRRRVKTRVSTPAGSG